MKTESMLGRSLFVAAALAFATPTVAQSPSQTESDPISAMVSPVTDTIPVGLDIPREEAEQMRGGKIKLALVVVKYGRTVYYRVIACTSSSSCRKAAIKRFGREAVRQIFWGTGLAAVQKLACKAGIRQFC